MFTMFLHYDFESAQPSENTNDLLHKCTSRDGRLHGLLILCTTTYSSRESFAFSVYNFVLIGRESMLAFEQTFNSSPERKFHVAAFAFRFKVCRIMATLIRLRIVRVGRRRWAPYIDFVHSKIN